MCDPDNGAMSEVTPPAHRPKDSTDTPRRQRSIQSIEVGMRVLDVLTEAGQALPLKEVAQRAAMPPGKAHPYLVSFLNVGLVKQHPLTGLYELGPKALQLGLAALEQLDPLTEASGEAAQLAADSGLSVALVVRGNLGPTVVRLDEPRYPLHMNLRVGTVTSMLGTVTGRVFAAFLPDAMVRAMVAGEHERVIGGRSGAGVARPQGGLGWLDSPEIQRTLADIRTLGVGSGVGLPLPGVNTLSAPVFDGDGTMVLAISVIGPHGVFDPDPHGPIAALLRAAAARVSERLGARAGRSRA